MSLSLSLFYLINFAVSLVAGLLFYFIIPTSRNSKPWQFLLATCAFCFFLPGLGLACLLLLFLYFFIRRMPRVTPIISTISKPSQFTHAPKTSQFGVGGVTQRLSSAALSIQKRTEALLALSSLQSAEKNALMRQTLSDDTDQIRLLAFSLLDQQEKEISSKINRLRQQYQNEVPGSARTQLEIQLAQEYWELIYHDLVQGDLKNSVLSLAFEYANLAWDEKNPDPKLAVLLSKLYLEQHNTQRAEDILNVARMQGVKATQVLPYLASISFQKRDFATLRRHLKENPNLKDVPKLHQVVEFWQGKA